MPPFPNEYDYDLDEFAPPKPLSPERRAEIEELYARIAADPAEINN